MNIDDPIAVEFLYYNRWANIKLIDACCDLTRDQLATSVPGTFGTVYDTLQHIIESEAGYYRLLTNISLDPPFLWDDHPPLADIRPYAEQVSDAFVDAAGQIAGTGSIREEWQGQTLEYRPLTLLIQVVNHGVEHRTNITTILAQLGIQPPVIDGWEYMLSNLDRMGA